MGDKMIKLKFIRNSTILMIAIIFTFFFFNQSSYASANYEAYKISPSQISEEILKNTIGLFRMSGQYYYNPNKLVHYIHSDGQFKSSVLPENFKFIPITGYGCDSDPELYASFPILRKKGKYIHIVINVLNNYSVWVEENSGYSIYFNEINTTCCINIFLFAGLEKRKIYEKPTENSNFVILNRYHYMGGKKGEFAPNFDFSRFKLIEQNGNWIKIVKLELNHATEEVFEGKQKGWIQIKNNQGKLTIWIVGYSDMEYH